jgi:hypothetical protein
MDGRNFICDHMLGRMARWLRMAGYDTLLMGPMDDKGIYGLAKYTGRVLLTSDKDLASRRGIATLRIISDSLDEQMREFIAAFPRTHGLTTRCPACNGILEVHGMDEAGESIPPNVRLMHEVFYRCISCGKEYWSGTHWEGIVNRLTRIGAPPELPARPQVKSNPGS